MKQVNVKMLEEALKRLPDASDYPSNYVYQVPVYPRISLFDFSPTDLSRTVEEQAMSFQKLSFLAVPYRSNMHSRRWNEWELLINE